jgi:hypothetical protein
VAGGGDAHVGVQPLSKKATSVKSTIHVLHYDPWLTASGDRLIAMAEHFFELLSAPAITPGRKHRTDANLRRKVCATALMANLVMVTLAPSQYEGLAVPLGNRKLTRYDRRDFNTDILRLVIDEADAAGLVTIEEAIFKERRTIIAPTQSFQRRVVGYAISLADVGQLEGGELIELWAGSRRSGHKTPVDYKDCPRAETMRAEMRAINQTLNDADIRLDRNGAGPIRLVRKFRIDQPEDAQEFDRHGRLYGGFWEGLPKDRRHSLTIGGEPVVDLDFASMFLHLAYICCGAEPPTGDLYAIPGLEGHRKTVKSLMVSLFFRNAEARRLPLGAKDELPSGWSMERFKAAAVQAHPSISSLFDTNVGFKLMALESDILVGILLELARNGVAALPMHDGIMVAASKKYLATDTMEKVSGLKSGRPLPVIEKAIPIPSPNNSPLWTTRGA